MQFIKCKNIQKTRIDSDVKNCEVKNPRNENVKIREGVMSATLPIRARIGGGGGLEAFFLEPEMEFYGDDEDDKDGEKVTDELINPFFS